MEWEPFWGHMLKPFFIAATNNRVDETKISIQERNILIYDEWLPKKPLEFIMLVLITFGVFANVVGWVSIEDFTW